MSRNPLNEAGIHEGVPAPVYHACTERISRGQLWTLHTKSPEHLRHELDNKTPATRAMLRGSALHTAVLEPEEFARQYAIPPDVDRRTKDGRVAWEAFMVECECSGRVPLGWDPVEEKLYRSDVETVLTVSRKLAADKRLSQLFRDGEGTTESSYCWDEDQCKYRVRYDRLNKARRGWISLDLKSSADARMEKFQRSVIDYGYHFQAAMYSDGFKALRDEELAAFVFVVYETEPPYAHAFFECSPELIAAGRFEYRAAVDRLRRCMESGEWPGYEDNGVQPLNLPKWYT